MEAAFWKSLHPTITKIAQSRFNTGHYADAVEAALRKRLTTSFGRS